MKFGTDALRLSFDGLRLCFELFKFGRGLSSLARELWNIDAEQLGLADIEFYTLSLGGKEMDKIKCWVGCPIKGDRETFPGQQ